MRSSTANPEFAGAGCSRPSVEPGLVTLPLCPFPPLPWWCAALQDGATLDVHEHYPKRTFRNRMVLAQSTGLRDWTVPVERRAGIPRRQDDTRRIAGDADRKAWQAIRSAYGNAPFFEEMCDELEALFLEGPETLGAWNMATLEWMSGWLDVQVPLPEAKRLPLPVDHAFQLESWSKWWNLHHIRWPHIWQDRMGQVDFSKMSGLDALLHLGPAAAGRISPFPRSGFPHRV